MRFSKVIVIALDWRPEYSSANSTCGCSALAYIPLSMSPFNCSSAHFKQRFSRNLLGWRLPAPLPPPPSSSWRVPRCDSPHHCHSIFMKKSQAVPTTTPEESGLGEDPTLSGSATPPRRIVPRKRTRKSDAVAIDTSEHGVSPSQTSPGKSKMATPAPHQPAKGSTDNPLKNIPSPKATRKPLGGSSTSLRLKISAPARPATPTKFDPQPLGPKVPRTVSSSSKSLSSTQPPCPHECECKYASAKSIEIIKHVTTYHPACAPTCSCHHVPAEGDIGSVDSIAAKQEKPVKRPTVQELPPPNGSPVPSNVRPSPVDLLDPIQPENASEAASQFAEKSTPQQKVVQGGPKVAGPTPNQTGTSIEPGSQSEGSPVKSPSTQSRQNSFEPNIESLYASPSPEKTATELIPIELDSDPDFEMMERMLFSHRGPSSQSIKKEPVTHSWTLPKAERPLKRQRSRSSPNKSSHPSTQTPQADSKPASKRPRVKGPHSSDSVVVLNNRRKHPEFWDLDGTVVLQVDDVLFRVMRSTLSKASPWFQRLFSEELDHLEIMAGCPVYMIEEDFNHLDFANLLRGLENGL